MKITTSNRVTTLIHHKLMQAMAEREERYVLEGQVQVDDAYLGGERSGGKVGRGSENKVPFVAAVSLSERWPSLAYQTHAGSRFYAQVDRTVGPGQPRAGQYGVL